jgi:hypothetical protein
MEEVNALFIGIPPVPVVAGALRRTKRSRRCLEGIILDFKLAVLTFWQTMFSQMLMSKEL